MILSRGKQVQELGDERGGGVEHLLTVVEHGQEIEVAQLFRQGLGPGPAVVITMTEAGRQRERHERGIAERCELDPPHPSREVLRFARRRRAEQAASCRNRPNR